MQHIQVLYTNVVSSATILQECGKSWMSGNMTKAKSSTFEVITLSQSKEKKLWNRNHSRDDDLPPQPAAPLSWRIWYLLTASNKVFKNEGTTFILSGSKTVWAGKDFTPQKYDPTLMVQHQRSGHIKMRRYKDSTLREVPGLKCSGYKSSILWELPIRHSLQPVFQLCIWYQLWPVQFQYINTTFAHVLFL